MKPLIHLPYWSLECKRLINVCNVVTSNHSSKCTYTTCACLTRLLGTQEYVICHFVALLGGGVKVSLSIKSCSRRCHEASPPRSLIMGRSSNLSMQYIFLLLIVIAITTQAYMLGYQDLPEDRRNDSHHDPRKITETQQPRYLKITKKKSFLFNRF